MSFRPGTHECVRYEAAHRVLVRRRGARTLACRVEAHLDAWPAIAAVNADEKFGLGFRGIAQGSGRSVSCGRFPLMPVRLLPRTDFEGDLGAIEYRSFGCEPCLGGVNALRERSPLGVQERKLDGEILFAGPYAQRVQGLQRGSSIGPAGDDVALLLPHPHGGLVRTA